MFIDNDVLVTKGRLKALVACVDDTAAWVGGPYVPPTVMKLTWSDTLYVVLRWGFAWNHASLAHIPRKWRLPDDDPTLLKQFSAWENWRASALLGPIERYAKIFGWRIGARLHQNFCRIEHKLNAILIKDTLSGSQTRGVRLVDAQVSPSEMRQE